MPLRIPSAAPASTRAACTATSCARPPRAPPPRTAPAAPPPFASRPRCPRRSSGSTSAPQSVGHELRRAADPGRHHRPAAGQRLQQRLALRLDQAGLAEHVAAGQLGDAAARAGRGPGTRTPRRRDRPQPAVERAARRRSAASPRPAAGTPPAAGRRSCARSASRRTGTAARRPAPAAPGRQTVVSTPQSITSSRARRARQPLGQVLGHADHRTRPGADHRAGGRGHRAAPLGVGDVAAVGRDHERPARWRRRSARSAPGSGRRRRRA